MAGLRLITAPPREPLWLDEAKNHLRVDTVEEDSQISRLITAARQDLDAREGRLMGVALITQTWELVLDAFPLSSEIRSPFRPLQSVASIKYDDVNGAEQTMPSADYIVDIASYTGRVVLAPDKSWPGTRNVINAVRVRLAVGYGDHPGLIPETYRQAMLLMVAHLYANRGDGGDAAPPETYFALLGVRGGAA